MEAQTPMDSNGGVNCQAAKQRAYDIQHDNEI